MTISQVLHNISAIDATADLLSDDFFSNEDYQNVVNYNFKGAMIAPLTVNMHMDNLKKVLNLNGDESEYSGYTDIYDAWKMSPYGRRGSDTEMP